MWLFSCFVQSTPSSVMAFRGWQYFLMFCLSSMWFCNSWHNYLLIRFLAILRTVPDNLFSPLLCLFLFVDCLVRIWFLFALLLFKDDPVFLNLFDAPECVFNLYPIILIIFSLMETISLIVVSLPRKVLGQLEKYLKAHFWVYQEVLSLNHY